MTILLAGGTNSFNYTITDKCGQATINATVIPDTYYIIGNESIKSISFAAWNISDTDSIVCVPFNYSISINSSSNLTQYPFITFNSTGKILNISTTNFNDTGTYIINITGTTITNRNTISSFKIILVNPCLNNNYSITTISN